MNHLNFFPFFVLSSTWVQIIVSHVVYLDIMLSQLIQNQKWQALWEDHYNTVINLSLTVTYVFIIVLWCLLMYFIFVYLLLHSLLFYIFLLYSLYILIWKEIYLNYLKFVLLLIKLFKIQYMKDINMASLIKL